MAIFSLVEGFEKEWGYFTLDDLEKAKKGDLPWWRGIYTETYNSCRGRFGLAQCK